MLILTQVGVLGMSIHHWLVRSAVMGLFCYSGCCSMVISLFEAYLWSNYIWNDVRLGWEGSSCLMSCSPAVNTAAGWTSGGGTKGNSVFSLSPSQTVPPLLMWGLLETAAPLTQLVDKTLFHLQSNMNFHVCLIPCFCSSCSSPTCLETWGLPSLPWWSAPTPPRLSLSLASR